MGTIRFQFCSKKTKSTTILLQGENLLKGYMTPIKAIRAKCLDCCCCQHKEVRLCTVLRCPVWLYRMGRKPTEGDVAIYLNEITH